MPQRGEVDGDPAGHAHQHHPSPGPHQGQRLGDRGGAADAVEHHVGALGQPAAQHERPGRPAHGAGQLVGRDDLVGAERGGQLALTGVLGPDHDRARRRRAGPGRRGRPPW